MSEKKFNLKNYVKIDGDIPIGSRLMDEHGNVPNEITEKQLDSNRVTEKDVTIEKLLEKNRNGGADILPEGRLNTEKSKLAKYRNPEAYEGDMNKVEEWRLANDPVEDEKYSDASTTPKGLRWWEQGGKSPDGLKVASNKKTLKKAQVYTPPYYDDEDEDEDIDVDVDELSFDEGSGFDRLKGVWSDEEGLMEDTNITPTEHDFEIRDETVDAPELSGDMKIKEQKDINGPINGIYMLLEYDASKFNGDEEVIKDAALSKVIDTRPELAGLITEEDFSDIKENGDNGSIKLRALGDEFGAINLGTQDLDVPQFSNLKLDDKKIGGTSITSGSLRVNGGINEETIAKEVVDYLEDKYPGLGVTEESLDLSKLNDGLILFMVSPDEGNINNDTDEFPIEESFESEGVFAQAQSIVKKK